MTSEERQFLLTTAWFYARHGQTVRARTLCAALVEENPMDAVAAAALAEFQLADGEPEAALNTVADVHFPSALARAGALLESRALRALGRDEIARRRWQRYLRSQGHLKRRWVS